MTTKIKYDRAERLRIQEAIIDKHCLPADWKISDSEIESLIQTSSDVGFDIDKLIDSYSHIDTETGDVVTEGWLCFGGRYFFTSETSALKKVREYGFRSLNLASWANSTMGATYFKSPYK